MARQLSPLQRRRTHDCSVRQATKDLPAVKEMLEKAAAVLGYDLLKLCLEGPKEQLDETRCGLTHMLTALPNTLSPH